MENMDEIIRIQKDSITISQSEVESLHKTLQEKVKMDLNFYCARYFSCFKKYFYHNYLRPTNLLRKFLILLDYSSRKDDFGLRTGEKATF